MREDHLFSLEGVSFSFADTVFPFSRVFKKDLMRKSPDMGSVVELNDTLQITREQGFPAELTLERHTNSPLTAGEFLARKFEFHSKKGARIYHIPPVRVFLVENIGGKWLYWGHALVLEQTIYLKDGIPHTRGIFEITEIYPPDYQREITLWETSPGKSYF